MIGQQVPYTISQNVSFATNPTDFSTVRTIADPFPAIVQVKPRTTEELQAANPRVLGHSFENETPYAEQWHFGIDRRLFGSTALELTYAGSTGKHIVFCYNPNEVQPGIGTQESRRLIQPLNRLNAMLQCDPRNSSNYHSGQLKLTQRFHNGLQLLGSYTYGKSLDYGGSAASGAGAVGNPQTVTNLKAGYGPSGFDVRHRAVVSWVYELPWGPNRHWMREGGILGEIVGGWQLAGIATMTTGRPFTVFMQTGVNNGAPSWPNRIGSGELDNPSVNLWVQPCRLQGAARQYLRKHRPRHPLRAGARELRHVPVEAVHARRSNECRVPMGCVQPVQSSGLWFPESELRFADRGEDHDDCRGQQIDAVLGQGELLV